MIAIGSMIAALLVAQMAFGIARRSNRITWHEWKRKWGGTVLIDSSMVAGIYKDKIVKGPYSKINEEDEYGSRIVRIYTEEGHGQSK